MGDGKPFQRVNGKGAFLAQAPSGIRSLNSNKVRTTLTNKPYENRDLHAVGFFGPKLLIATAIGHVTVLFAALFTVMIFKLQIPVPIWILVILLALVGPLFIMVRNPLPYAACYRIDAGTLTAFFYGKGVSTYKEIRSSELHSLAMKGRKVVMSLTTGRSHTLPRIYKIANTDDLFELVCLNGELTMAAISSGS